MPATPEALLPFAKPKSRSLVGSKAQSPSTGGHDRFEGPKSDATEWPGEAPVRGPLRVYHCWVSGTVRAAKAAKWETISSATGQPRGLRRCIPVQSLRTLRGARRANQTDERFRFWSRPFSRCTGLRASGATCRKLGPCQISDLHPQLPRLQHPPSSGRNVLHRPGRAERSQARASWRLDAPCPAASIAPLFGPSIESGEGQRRLQSFARRPTPAYWPIVFFFPY